MKTKVKVLLSLLTLGSVCAVSIPFAVSCGEVEKSESQNNGQNNQQDNAPTTVSPNDAKLGITNYLSLKPFNDGGKAMMRGNSAESLTKPIGYTSIGASYTTNTNNIYVKIPTSSDQFYFSLKLPTKLSELFDNDTIQKLECDGGAPLTWGYVEGNKAVFSTIDKANNIKTGTLANNKKIDTKIYLTLKVSFQNKNQETLSKDNIKLVLETVSEKGSIL